MGQAYTTNTHLQMYEYERITRRWYSSYEINSTWCIAFLLDFVLSLSKYFHCAFFPHFLFTFILNLFLLLPANNTNANKFFFVFVHRRSSFGWLTVLCSMFICLTSPFDYPAFCWGRKKSRLVMRYASLVKCQSTLCVNQI